MSDFSFFNTESKTSRKPTKLLYIIIGIVFAILMIASGPQALDPLLRHDDFPALFADPNGYYTNTLHEGRWLNYWWSNRGFVTPAWLNFAIYQFFWATFASATAINACGRNEQSVYIIALALLIVFIPPAFLISAWFNVLLPGLGLVASFAVLSIYITPSRLRLILPFFVLATLTVYTTYPLLLLVVCLTNRDLARSWRDLITLVVIFIASFAAALLAIYSLNYLEHGIFGIPLAEWRTASPAYDLTSAIANLKIVSEFCKNFATMLGYGVTPLLILFASIITISFYIMVKNAPLYALYIATGILMGFGLAILQMVFKGAIMPPRALIFIWVLFCILCVHAAIYGRDRGGIYERVSLFIMTFSIAIFLIFNTQFYLRLASWQVATMQLANQIGERSEPVYLMGSYNALPEANAAMIQAPSALPSRLTYLTGRKVYDCQENPDDCKALPSKTLVTKNITKIEVQQFPDRTEIHLPQLDE